MEKKYVKEFVEFKLLDRVLIRKLYVYLKPYRNLIVLSLLFLLISKAIEASVPILIGNVSQKILNGINLEFLEKQILLNKVLVACFLILGLLIFSYLLDSMNVYLKSYVGQKALFQLRQKVYDHILSMPLAYFDRHTVGRLMTRTIHDVDQINQMFSESFIPILGNIFLFICIFIGIVFLDWRIAFFVLLIMPIVFWLTNRFRYFQRIAYENIRTIVSAMNTFVQEHLMGAATIRNFGIQKQAKEHFEVINQDHCEAYLDSIYHFSFFIAGIDMIQNFSLIIVFVILVTFAPLGSEFQAGTFFTFSLYTLMFFRPLADLAERYNVLQAAMAAAGRIFDILEKKPENVSEGILTELNEIHSIVFKDVWFAYEKDNWVLKGLSFEIKKGEALAVVGVTGEGKTTIVSLLLRFYEHQKGIIEINGRDIREYSLKAIRSQFSVVLQDPVIFSGSIIDNIGLYDPTITKDQVEQVAKYLNLDSMIQRFQDGWQQQLKERGKSLSMGEMQLISLARAVAHYRSVLILDEATANIDSETEQMIQNALEKILKDKTSLVIAHRLSTIKDVTKILVLNNGQCAEIGSHQELLQAKGIYEKLFRLQFANS